MQQMTHFVLFGLQIEKVLFGGGHLDRHPLRNFHSEVREIINLLRVVGQQPQCFCTKLTQNLRADVIFPLIPAEAQREIGLQRVHPTVLQLVGAQLVDQTDAAPFLPEIEQDAPSLPFNLRHGRGKLPPQSQRIEPKASPVRHSE